LKPSKAAITQNLRDAGCQDAFIDAFLQAVAEGAAAQQERLLEEERSCILSRVREEQKKLDCFDFLRYQFIFQEEMK